MRCPACGHANRQGAKFCEECAAPLASCCRSCGAPLRAHAKFCDECAAPTRPADERDPADEAAARKVVTIVFADLVGSTALHERLDAESVRRFMGGYYAAMRTAVEAHGGTVTQLLGDGVKAIFGAPHVAEDDAIRAVRAAVAMQRAFRALADAERSAVGATGLRVAVNTGEVVAGDQTEIIGDPVNVAARLQEQGRDGDVVIGEATRRLVADLVTLTPLGSFALKGRAETVEAYRVVALDRPAGVPAAAFVGREDELQRLGAVYAGAVAARRARLAVILGSPGLGKSRLIDEFTGRLGEGATVLTAHCDAAGGATFAPLATAFRNLLHLDAGTAGDDLRAAIAAVLPGDEPERFRIAGGVAALIAGTPAPPEETFFVVRRLLAALAAPHPVVLAIDDLHWAEPLLLDLIEHLAQWGTDVPLLVLGAARPELRDTRSSLTAPGGLVSEVVTLGGLDAGAATRLAANVVGADELPAAIAGRVLATSEGNPLFVGELVRMLVHDGALKREGDRWTTGVELAHLEMPPTIHALLAARIERLRPEERTVLERAAVVGRQFSRAAVAYLLPPEVRADLDARIEALRRSELIEPDAGWFLGEPALRFHHVLIRDAAYRRLLKGTRAELHARLGDWIEGAVGEAVEHGEMIGWHLEQAHQHLRELGPIDERGRVLGERAARHLAAAGRRALARDDVPVAASLLGRALDRLDAADPARADLALDWCEALLTAGDVGPAARAIDELGRLVGDSARLRAWHTCFAGQLASLTEPQTLRATADAVAAAAEELAAAGDAAGEAKAHQVHAIALARLGKVGACEAALDRALAAARRGNDRRRANAVLAGAPLAALWGPSPVTRASGRCLDVVRVLRITQGAPAVEAVALLCQGVLEALRGRPEAARRMVASSRRMVEELGITHRLLEADVFVGLIELLDGDAVAAERSLRPAYEGLREHGLGIDAAQAAALLGRALLAQERAAEAEALSHESERLAGDDLQAAIAWRCVRAEALARRGGHASAVDFARAAVGLAAATDSLLYHADARLALAAALHAAGRSDEAAAEEARAIDLWEAKGAMLLAERARRGTTASARAERAPVAAVASPRTTRRRVHDNHATLHLARIDEAVVQGDLQAVASLFGDARFVDHVYGHAYGSDTLLERFRWLIERSADLAFRNEPIAVLGPSLALARWRETGSEVFTGDLAVGSYEVGGTVMVEADSEARMMRVESFAPDKLGDAVARLYERYAELLPEGPERIRAAATAHSVAALLGPPDRWPFAPDVEATDHRTVGFGSLRGADAVVRSIRTLIQLSDDFDNRIDDVLDLRSDALLVRWTNSGTDRASGGAFERNLDELWTFGADGLLARWEQFDADQDAKALARFDELTAAPPAARVTAEPLRIARMRKRRVRPNAATAYTARLDAAMAARDAEALAALDAELVEVVDHPTGSTYDGAGNLTTRRMLLKAKDLKFRHEPLATLGDSLALLCLSISASGAAGEKFDVGAYEHEVLVLGDNRRTELFAVDRLGDAVIRLYELYADLLPDGPARACAAATARSVAAVTGADIDRWEGAFAPAIESVDHRTLGTWSARGAEAVREQLRSLGDVARDITMREDEVLGLRSDAWLVRRTHCGTDRTSGGAYERPSIQLFVFGADGLMKRWEQFDVDREDEALARFDELTAQPPAARIAAATSPIAKTRERRVRANAATAHASRLDSAIATLDADALPALFADQLAFVEHTTGAISDRTGALFTFHSLLRAQHPTCRHEPLATLGDSLALCRVSTSGSGFTGGTFDVGAYEREEVILIEVDAQGRRRWGETFAADRLGNAVARLYERYAEILPEGSARARAAATARSVAAKLGPFDLARYATAFAPTIESVDHRTLGTWSARGAAAFLEHYRSMLELADNVAMREDDILGLRPDAFLVRRTNLGTDRASGGAYERQFLWLGVCGTDGLLTRSELFDSDRDAEALARFDELTAEPAVARTVAPASPSAKTRERRVRPNAATANTARLDAAIAARDADALSALFADQGEFMEHAMGATSDSEGAIFTFHSLLRAHEPTCRNEPLATLGDTLALCRQSMSGSAFASRSFDVGAYEREEIVLIEVDAQGRRHWGETFVPERLGDAVVGLYDRYAHLLPEGPARARAAATARSVALLEGILIDDPDRWVAAMAPAVAFVDRRPLGLPPSRGSEALVRLIRSLHELAHDLTARWDDVLALAAAAHLYRWTNWGTDRAGGGAFERHFLVLRVFGSEGLLTHYEFFDPERDAEALARFDELTAESATTRFERAPPRVVEKRTRRVRPNAATALAARVDAAMAARDAGALPALLADQYRAVDHTVELTFDREGALLSYRSLLSARDPTYRHEPLATLGDSLTLGRLSWFASGKAGSTFDVGAFEIDRIVLLEADAHGQIRCEESFAADRLGDAVARLYARYAELLPDGPARARAMATARSVAAMVGAFDPERYATALAPAVEALDHRTLGTHSAHGAAALLQGWRAWLALAVDITLEDDMLSLQPDALLLRRIFSATDRDGGGPFERPFLSLYVFGGDGLVTHVEWFDVDREEQALARCDELTVERRRDARIENAATRALQRFSAAWEARDWGRIAAALAPGFRRIDRRTVVNAIDLGRDGFVEWLRTSLAIGLTRLMFETIATRGERLLLARGRFEVADGTAGPSEIDWLFVMGVDDAGDQMTLVLFDPDDLDAAHAEIDERYAAGEAAPFAVVTTGARAFPAAVAARDWDALAAVLAPDLVVYDHRPLGWETLRGPGMLVDTFRSFVELAPDVRLRISHGTVSAAGSLAVVTFSGTHEGGEFEDVRIVVHEYDGNGKIRRHDIYNLDQIDDARARFAEIRPDALCIPPNAARRARDRVQAAFEAGDWAALHALAGEDYTYDDRRRWAQLAGGVELWIDSMQFVHTAGGRLVVRELIGTLGDRIALEHFLVRAGSERSPAESELLALTELGADGRLRATINFELGDRRAAFAEAEARFNAGEAAATGGQAPIAALGCAFQGHDWDELRRSLVPDLVTHDHRQLGLLGALDVDQWIESMRIQAEMAPDVDRETFRILAWNRQGRVDATRVFGTLHEGGPFENVFLRVIVTDGDHIQHYEIFDVDDGNRARARFEELCAHRSPAG